MSPRVLAEAGVVESRARCTHCGRLVAYVQNDVQERHGTDHGGGPDGEEFVRCPGDGCGKKIVIKAW